MTTDPNLRLPAAELAKLAPARARRPALTPPGQADPPRPVRRAVRALIGYARA